MPIPIEALAKNMIDAVKNHVARATAALGDRIARLENGLKELTAKPPDIEQIIRDAVKQAAAELPPAKDGADGINGKDADAEAIFNQLRVVASIEAERLVNDLPKAKDGTDGAPGKDGESIHPDTVALMIREAVDNAVAELPKAKDGADGRDALALDILPMIDATKSYPRGTYAEYRGGVIRALRNTDPVEDELSKAGWLVCMNGIAAENEELLGDGRTIRRTTNYTDGRELVRDIKVKSIIYREIWREGEYEAGDVVTWGGSVWHCQQKTADKPGMSAAWKLMVKHGAPGKDAKSGEPAPAQPVRLK